MPWPHGFVSKTGNIAPVRFRTGAMGLVLLGAGLQRFAKDIAQRRTRIRRAILRDGLLLLGDLHRLDREVRFLGAIEAADQCIELLPDLEALGTLLVAVAAK